MKIVSWNVNGIRACLKKDFMTFFQNIDADIFCVQETKASNNQVDLITPGYTQYWNSAEKKGYSGTLVLSKEPALNEIYDLGISKHDDEGRVITLEYQDFYLVNVYTPNSKRDLSRLEYRQNEWDVDFLSYVNELQVDKPVIFCGDLNVAHKEIDLKNPKSNTRNAGFTKEERIGFDNIVSNDYIDTFRFFNSEGDNYTWWSYMRRARERNIGWRIDYFCISKSLSENLNNAFIYSEIMGSDHCPIAIDIDF
ncbi:MAG: exodeoxyribonuclease III [Chloroflexota bacterium]|jgi:exodeoxyribonuclease-3|nr:exodeoxyribonuclease III [Chloroflexota bacterium]|tara:strand:- start:5427 stop:6182 length:756 start_codon:yes stop_codon:yes gene_type:complete